MFRFMNEKIYRICWLVFLPLIIFSCVPKATEKNAVCGTNQAFNSVTRTCYSIAEVRYLPVGTLSSGNLNQETPKLFELTYTDKNNDTARSCSVTGVHSQLEAISSVIQDKSIGVKIADLQDALNSLAASIHYYRTINLNAATIAADTQAAADLVLITNYLNTLNDSFYIPTVETNVVNVQNATSDLLAQGAPYLSNFNINYFYNLSQTRLTVVNDYYTSITNKCFCSGGKCFTYVIPKKGFSGAAGFNYTITDIDGVSASKNVSLNVAAYSKANPFLLPAVESMYISGNESYTSSPKSYAFDLSTAIARDYFSSTFTYSKTLATKTILASELMGSSPLKPTSYLDSSNVSHNITAGMTYVDSDLGLGIVTGCLGLGGSSATSTSCIYIPLNGDTSEVLVPTKSSGALDDLIFMAHANGTASDGVSIVYKDIGSDLTVFDPYSTTNEKFGLVSSAEELYVRVSGNTINVIIHPGLTTTAQIATAISNDMLAKTLVSVAGGSALTPAISSVTLAGGVDGYDTFSYKVSNAYGTSTNTAKVAFHITPVIDYPTFKYGFSLASTYKENSASRANDTAIEVIDLTPSFVAVDGVSTCTITDTSVGLYLSNSPPTCTCALNSCFATIYPKPNVVGGAGITFEYSVCNSLGVCMTPQTYTVNLTQVNDQPLVLTAFGAPSILENSTAAPSSFSQIVTTDPGNAYETSQTVTLTASSNNQTVIPNASIVFTPVSGHPEQQLLTIIPTKNQSAITPVTISIVAKDNGGTTDCSVITTCDTRNYSFTLGVTPVNDPPSFNTAVTSVNSNEGGYVIAGPFTIDEDLVNSLDENLDPISLVVTSDNQSVLMDTSIKIFYDLNDNGIEDTGESRANNVMLETASGNDSSLHKFYLKLTPVGGTSGSANVTIAATDGTNVVAPAKTSYYTFSFIVNPVAAIHGGWNNISAVGLKTDKLGQPASVNDMACNYNKTSDPVACSGGDCYGLTSPYASITTTKSNVLFKDNSNKKCYYSYANPVAGGTPAYLWKLINTSCPVSRTTSICNKRDKTVVVDPTGVFTPASVGLHYYNSETKTFYVSTGLTSANWSTNTICNTANAIITSGATAKPLPTAVEQYYFDTTTNTCVKSLLTGTVFSWNTAKPYIPSKVTLAWKPFTLSGSGSDLLDTIDGYNVYRRETGTDYDLKNGFLKLNSTDTMTITGASTLTFTDTTADAGKVYYYSVRPVDHTHKFATYTPEIISEVRLITPTQNFAFVHRWMINQEMCTKMHMTTQTVNKIDTSHNYRCPFYGPGSTGGYYDYGSDILVDISEMSCPYTLNTGTGHCTNGANGCIGIGVPGVDVTLTNAVPNDVYYDRNLGVCYVMNAGFSWINYDTASASAALISGINSGSFDQYNTALNPPLVNIKNSSAKNICADRSAPSVYKNSATLMSLTGAAAGKLVLPEKKDYMAYSAAPLQINGVDSTDSLIADTEQGDSLNVQSRCNGSSASGLENYYTDSDLPTSSYIFTLPGTASSGIRSLYTGSVPWGYNYGTEACVSRYGIQDLYGNVAEWTKDQMQCADTNTKICTSVAGTNTHYDFSGSGTAFYGFDLLTGPFADTNGSGLAGDIYTSLYDTFLSSWNFEDETFEATKFSFPLALPMYTNFSSLIACPYSPGKIGTSDPNAVVAGVAGQYYLDHSNGKCYISTGAMAWSDVTGSLSAPINAGTSFIQDIGSSNGITYSQLHGDAFIVNAASIYADPTHIGAFATGGSFLSTTQSGRYTSELIPDASMRVDVGFRCMVPVPKTEYDLTDSFHHYTY